jgi:hypothetical protein
MKTKLVLSLFALLLSADAWGRTKPDPADYTVNVQVNQSRMISRGNSGVHWQELGVVIDG